MTLETIFIALMVIFLGLGLMLACVFVAIERAIKAIREIRMRLDAMQQAQKGE